MTAPVSHPDDPALLRIDGPIATITLNRPTAFNSVNLAIAQKLEQLAAYLESDDAIRVLVIEGEGRAFSAGGSTVGIVGTVGSRRALQIFLSEDNFTAQQAHEWGLVAKIVPATELKAATRQFAERLAQNPPAAIAGTKSLVYAAATTPVKQQLDAAEHKIIMAMNTEDFRVAVKKFTSKSK